MWGGSSGDEGCSCSSYESSWLEWSEKRAFTSVRSSCLIVTSGEVLVGEGSCWSSFGELVPVVVLASAESLTLLTDDLSTFSRSASGDVLLSCSWLFLTSSASLTLISNISLAAIVGLLSLSTLTLAWF